MGRITKDFGRFSVETRHESFYLHASYGTEYQPPTATLADVMPGSYFRSLTDHPEVEDDAVTVYIVDALMTETSDIRKAPGTEVETTLTVRHDGADNPPEIGAVVIPCEEDGSYALIEVAVEHSLANLWSSAHPEIELVDMADLVSAIAAGAKNTGQFTKAQLVDAVRKGFED